jgi:hypothetical protein
MVEGSKNGEGLLSINADATGLRQKVAASIPSSENGHEFRYG